MQQFCNNCGSPISAGMSVCARCGTPVSSGSGAYDPTIRAGAPPGSGYGQQPYGPPPIDPYGAPPPPPPGFGSQPQSGFGGTPPPPPPGFGPPPQPGFGAPPGVGYGGPQQPFMAPQPKKSNTWIYIVLGIVIVVLLVCGGIGFAIYRAANNVANTVISAVNQTATAQAQNPGQTPAPGSFQQTKTTGTHITTIQTGTSFDQNSGTVQGERATFTTSDTIWVVYTVANPDSGAQVVVKLLDSNGSLLDSGNSAPLSAQTNTYANSLTVSQAGVYNVEIDYNGAAEATINFQVTS